jgi:uncharacterized protein
MNELHSNPMDRREFLQAGIAATAATGLVAQNAGAQEPKAGSTGTKPILAKRKLGKTGVEVTLLNHGTVGEPAGLNRLLRAAYAEGVRYFDTAEGYKNSEKVIGEWLAAMPEVRKNIFLATKSHVHSPMDMLKKLDERLERLQTDYVDLLFFHGLNTAETDWPKSKELKDAVEALKKTGKVKFVGFSTHDAMIAQQIQNAAEGGFVDVIMLKYTPWLDKDSPLNKALDACHAKNIGPGFDEAARRPDQVHGGPCSVNQGQGADSGPGLASGDLDRRAILGLVRDAAEYRADPRECRCSPPL